VRRNRRRTILQEKKTLRVIVGQNYRKQKGLGDQGLSGGGETIGEEKKRKPSVRGKTGYVRGVQATLGMCGVVKKKMENAKKKYQKRGREGGGKRPGI